MKMVSTRRKENMLQLLNLIVGMVLFAFDYGSDIYVAVQYWQNGEIWWFWLTVAFIIVPSIIVNITAIFQQKSVRSIIAGVFQLSIAVRYFEAIFYLVTPHRIYSLAKLRYLETITESAPQWCLQVYIMLRKWSFPPYTIASSVLSFLSLVWSIRTLEKERARDDKVEFSLCEAFVFLTWQTFTLISRLSAIIFIGYLSPYALVFLAAHYFLLTVLYTCPCRPCEDCDGMGSLKLLFSSFVATYPSLYHPANLRGILPIEDPKLAKAKMILAYIFIHVENILIVAVCSTVELPDAKHMDMLKPIALWCHAGGTVISFIFFLIIMCRKDNMALLKLTIRCCNCQDDIVHLNLQFSSEGFGYYDLDGEEHQRPGDWNDENTQLLSDEQVQYN